MIDVNLTEAELRDICRPLTQPAAQVRYLQSIGVTARRRPDGTVLVCRAHYNDVMSKTLATAGDDDQPVWSVPL